MTNEENDNTGYKASLREEVQSLSVTDVVSPAYQRRKLLIWFVRNLITAMLCWIFWEKPWVKWVLWIGIPLAILNLLMILIGPYLLRRKIKSLQRKIEGI